MSVPSARYGRVDTLFLAGNDEFLTPEPKYTEEEREIVYRALVLIARYVVEHSRRVEVGYAVLACFLTSPGFFLLIPDYFCTSMPISKVFLSSISWIFSL